MRVENKRLRAWGILTDPAGKAAGWMKFRGDIRPDAPDHFLGEINAAFYTLDFVALPILSMSTPTEGWRVAVEAQWESGRRAPVPDIDRVERSMTT